MVCARCGHANQPEARFCSSCGASLEVPVDESTLTLLAVEAAGVEDELAAYLEGLPPGVGLLVVRHGPNVGSSFRLDAEHTNVGRHPDSEIFLDDITVSRRHAEVRRLAEGYEVVDVGSLNGTYLNRERVEEGELRNGDEIQIGKYKLAYYSGR